MSTSKNYQMQQAGFGSYRPVSPKTTCLTTNSFPSTSGSQTPSNSIHQRAKMATQVESNDSFASIRHENTILREENRALKRELNLMKGEFFTSQQSSNNKHEVNDLRETIKKQAGQIKDLKMRLQVISKQCKMYEQIIDKMQTKINKLSQENKHLEHLLLQSKTIQREKREQKSSQKSTSMNMSMKISKETIAGLTQKINNLCSMQAELQAIMHTNDKEWEMWKEQWGKQKLYYLNRIKDLEAMMGIGVETKEFFKKRH